MFTTIFIFNKEKTLRVLTDFYRNKIHLHSSEVGGQKSFFPLECCVRHK